MSNRFLDSRCSRLQAQGNTASNSSTIADALGVRVDRDAVVPSETA